MSSLLIRVLGTLLGVAALLLVVAIVMTQLPVADRSRFTASTATPDQVTLFAFGDHGAGDYRQRRVAAMLEDACRLGPPDFIQTLGDNFYPDGVATADDALWQTHFRDIYNTPCLSTVAFRPALGNHDYGLDPEAQVAYSARQGHTGRWQMPGRYYAYEIGEARSGQPLVGVVVLDTMQPLPPQLDLLARAFDADNAPRWRVVVAHHNIRTYSVNYHDDTRFTEALLPALRAAGVHLYLSGHSHNLQLIEFPDEPIYVIAGGGGKSPRALLEDDGGNLRFSSSELGFAALVFTDDGLAITLHRTPGSFLTSFRRSTETFNVAYDCIAAPTDEPCLP